MKEKLSKMLIGGLIFFSIGIILIWLNIIKLASVLGHIVGYSLPIVMVINIGIIFSFVKFKEYNLLGKWVLSTFVFCIVACLIYLGLASLDIVNPIYGYVFLYVVFPYLLLVLLVYVFYLAKEKQLKKGKSIFRKLFILLIIGFSISHFFK